MSRNYVLKIQFVHRPPETLNLSAATTTIGREFGDIILNDPQASGRHAELRFVAGKVTVRDVGSTNGTWFHGRRLEEFGLEPGQWFQIGQTTLQLVAVHLAPSPAPSAAGPARTIMGLGAIPPSAASGPYQEWTGSGWAPGGHGPGGGSAPGPVPGPSGSARAAASAYPGGARAPLPALARPPAEVPAPAGGGGPSVGDAAVWTPPPGGPPPTLLAPVAPGGYAPPVAGQAGGPPAVAPWGGPHWPSTGPGEVRPHFRGSGGALFITCLLGVLFSILTLYLYVPWFACRLARYVASNTTLGPTQRGELRTEFTGTGSELLTIYLAGVLLTVLTCGIYMPWFVCKLLKFFADNAQAVADDGTRYRLHFEGRGKELFIRSLLGMLACVVSLYIYAPWFVCKLVRWTASNTRILENEVPVGTLDFEGSGGALFLAYVGGIVAVLLTASLYYPWFQVKLTKFFAEGLRVTVRGQTYEGAFHGTGGELFVLMLVHGFLTIVTAYIYLPWFLAKQWRFGLNNRSFHPSRGFAATPPVPAFQPQIVAPPPRA